jgi:small subunit ribosomal protein S21
LAEVKIHEGESIEAALRRFKREVIKAGIILEVKKRQHHENKGQMKKRKKAETKRKLTLSHKRRVATPTKDKEKERERPSFPRSY